MRIWINSYGTHEGHLDGIKLSVQDNSSISPFKSRVVWSIYHQWNMSTEIYRPEIACKYIKDWKQLKIHVLVKSVAFCLSARKTITRLFWSEKYDETIFHGPWINKNLRWLCGVCIGPCMNMIKNFDVLLLFSSLLFIPASVKTSKWKYRIWV